MNDNANNSIIPTTEMTANCVRAFSEQQLFKRERYGRFCNSHSHHAEAFSRSVLTCFLRNQAHKLKSRDAYIDSALFTFVLSGNKRIQKFLKIEIFAFKYKCKIHKNKCI